MNLTTTSRDVAPFQRMLRVEVPAEEVERGLQAAARSIQRRAQIPGFRRGKVPLEMVRTQFAALVEQDFLDDVLPRAVQEAVRRAEVEPAAPPLVRDLRLQVGRPLAFEVQVDLRPAIQVRDYRGIPVSVGRRAVTDAAVDAVLARLRDDAAAQQEVDRPAGRGDVVVLDSTRLDAQGHPMPSTRTRNVHIQLGAPDVLPDLENGLLGARAGQDRTMGVAYPAAYPVAELAGQSMRYTVRIRKILEKKPRELDDNFAKDLFHLDTLEALRERVRANLEEEEAERVRREVEGQLTEALIRANPFDLPERMVDYMLDRVIDEVARGREPDAKLREELAARYRPGVEHSLRRELLLEAVARAEGLTVSDDEVLEEIERLVQASPREAARVRARYQAPERREGLKDRLLERKALDGLARQARIEHVAVGAGPLVVPATR